MMPDFGRCANRNLDYQFTCLILYEVANFNLEHTGISAKDSVALRAWYERVLGARPLWDKNQNLPTSLIAFGNVWVEMFRRTKRRR
jgi:hypothetical protein